LYGRFPLVREEENRTAGSTPAGQEKVLRRGRAHL